MANEKNIVTKIYKISIEGADDLVKKIEGINTNIDKYKIAIRDAKKEKLTSKEDIAAQQTLNKTIAESEAEVKRLNAERKVATKELQNYVNGQQKAVEQQLKEANQVKALPGSYKALYDEYKRLNTELRNTPKTASNFEQIKGEVTRLKTEVDNFNRQFTKDGTLVGEYTSGILKAFKTAGLDDLIKNQGNLIKGEIDKLDKEFIDLQKEVSNIGVTSDGSFQALEKRLIENRQESQKLESQLEKVNVELKGVGGIGGQVTDGLKNGFKNVTGNISQMVVGLFAFQQGISFLKDSVTEFSQAETNTIRLKNALKNLGNESAFEELKQQADELAKSLGFVDNDDIVKAQEKLVTFGKLSTSQIKAAIPTIVDLASNLGVSIPEASSIFLKAIEGSGKALKEYGIKIKDGGTEAERFNILQNELANKVKGSAKSMSESSSGGARQFKQLLADIKEEVGAKLLPILVALGTFLLGLPWGTIAAAVGAVTIAFTAYRIQLTLAAFAQGTLAKNTFAYFALNNLRIAQQAILNGLQAAQNFLLSAYTAIIIAANSATGTMAVVIRGLGIAFRFLTGPVGLFITLTTALVTVFGVLGTKAASTSKATNDLAKSQAELAAQSRVNAEIAERISKSIGEQVAKIRTLTSVTTNQNLSDETRKKALNELIAISPKYGEALNKNVIDINKVTEASNTLIATLQAQARIQAIIATRQKKEDRRFELENKIEASFTPIFAKDGKTVIGREVKNNQKGVLSNALASLLGNTKTQELEKDRTELQQVNEELKVIDKEVETNVELQKAIAQKVDNNKGLSNIDPNKKDAAGKNDKPKTAEQIRQDRLKQLQDEFEAEKLLLQIDKENKVIDEVGYLNELKDLTLLYNNEKLDILKGSTAEERKQINESQLEKITIVNETSKKIQEINEKRFEDENKKLKESFDKSKQLLQDDFDKVADNSQSTELQKTQAKIEYYNGLISLLLNFNTSQESLEKQFKFKSVENEKERVQQIKEARKDLSGEQAKEPKEQLDEIKRIGEKQLQEYKNNFSKQRQAIFNNDNLSISDKKKRVEAINKLETDLILASELATAKIELERAKLLKKQGKITDDLFNAIQDDFNKKAEKYAENQTTGTNQNEEKSLTKILTDKFKNLFGKNSDSEGLNFIGEAIGQTYDLAKEAMNSYFDAQRNRLEEEKNAKLEKIDIEKQQLLDQAQSAAERESIERQYNKKKIEIEKEAFEKNKELQKKQIKISLAQEIAAIAIAAAQNPLNGVTFGAAGAIQFAVMSALAVARSAIQIGNINSQKFERGGMPTNTGGKINGPSHSNGGVPFNYEAEGGELAIINKKAATSKRMMTVTGTAMQIASAINEAGGGVRFATGAKVRKFELGGSLGSNVKAPVFIPSFSNASNNNSQDFSQVLDAIINTAQAVQAVSSRIDNLQVNLNPNDVRAENKKFVKQTDLATL